MPQRLLPFPFARTAKIRAASLLLCCLACAGTTERAAWIDDFEKLKSHMAVAYANLEWTVERRELDLQTLNAQTLEALQDASSQRGARRAIERFLASFGDPHLRAERMQRPAPPRTGASNDETLLDPALSGDDAVDALGFRNGNLGFRLDLGSLPGFAPLPRADGNPFAAGVLTVAGGRRVGCLRIAEFGPDRYPEMGRRVWEDFRGQLQSPCGWRCQDEFWHAVSQALLEALAERVYDLRAANIDALLIDVTRNGGGTDWAGIAPRMLTAIPLECPPSGFIKHPHTTRRLEVRLERLDQVLQDPGLDATTRDLVFTGRQQLANLLQEGRAPCDRMPLWAGQRIDCSQIVRTSGCGLFAYLPPTRTPHPEAGEILYTPLEWTYSEGVWDGPLLVLVDRHTASAAEQFVTLLQANGAALILGERTLGAGCGYTYGGVPIFLPHVQLLVRMPDCIRYRGDGENELAGIEPDIALWGADDGDGRRVGKLATALAGLELRSPSP